MLLGSDRNRDCTGHSCTADGGVAQGAEGPVGAFQTAAPSRGAHELTDCLLRGHALYENGTGCG